MSFDESDLAATFDLFAGLALRGTCLAVLVLLAVFVLRKAISPQIRYVLLILALVRFALPVAPASGLSLFNVRPYTWFAATGLEEPMSPIETHADSVATLSGQQPVSTRAVPSAPATASDAGSAGTLQPPAQGDVSALDASIPRMAPPWPGAHPAQTSRSRLIWKVGLLSISGLGTVLILIRFVIAGVKRRAIFACATENSTAQRYASELLQELKSRRRLCFVTSQECHQISLHGFLRPVVTLPPWLSDLSIEDIRLLVRHELGHVLRLDHWVIGCSHVVAALHWWNPIVRRIITQLRRECELACDQSVLKELSDSERHHYAHLLLEVADRQIANRTAFTALAFTERVSMLRERIDQSLSFSQPTWRSRSIATLAIISVTIFGLTDGLPWSTAASEPGGATVLNTVPAPEVVNLSGRFVNQEGKPVSQAYVCVYGGRSTVEPVIKIADGSTDDEGHFHLQGTLPELLSQPSSSPLQLVAYFWKSHTCATVMREWTGNAMDSTLLVETSDRSKRIQGRVVDHRGKPVQGATILLPNRLFAAIPRSHYGLTNVEGQFEIPSVPADLDTKSLWVGHPDFGHMEYRLTEDVPDQLSDSAPVEDTAVLNLSNAVGDAASAPLKIVIPIAGGINGRVVNTVTESPIEACVVTAWSKDRRAFAQARTNEHGEYQLRVLPGDYSLTFAAGEANAIYEGAISVRAAKTVVANAIGIADERPVVPRAELYTSWLARAPDHVADAVGKSREYQFLPVLDNTKAETLRLLRVLRDQQDNHKSCTDEWAETMRALIELGSAAVPVLCEELDRTEQQDRAMLRSLPFILRGIGDTRAVPALIRAIPRCFGEDGSDMGCHSADPDLLSFMQQHDNHDRYSGRLGPDVHYSWGRPVNEVLPALRRLTGRGDGAFSLALVSARESERNNVLGQRLYNQAAADWAAFWESNWNQFLDDEQYRIVDLIPVRTGPMPAPPSRDLPFEHNSGEGNGFLGSVLSTSPFRVFRDLDTGLIGDLPEEFRQLSPKERRARMEDIIAWAREYGFDLMGSEVEQDGASIYVLHAIETDIWEISQNDFEQSITVNVMSSRGREVRDIIAHFDAEDGRADYPAAAYFCFVTSEGVAGKMLLGVPITSTNFIAGYQDHTADEFQHTGPQLGRRYALKWSKVNK